MELFNTVGIVVILLLLLYISINLIKKDIFLFDLIRSILTDNVDMKWQSMVDGSSEVLSGKGVLDKLFKKNHAKISILHDFRFEVKWETSRFHLLLVIFVLCLH